MAIKVIDVRNDINDQIFTIDLEGTIYTMRFVENPRTGVYKLDFMDSVGNPIVMGIACVVNWPLLSRFADERLPKGILSFWDSTGKFTEPTSDNIGITNFLLYEESA